MKKITNTTISTNSKGETVVKVIIGKEENKLKKDSLLAEFYFLERVISVYKLKEHEDYIRKVLEDYLRLNKTLTMEQLFIAIEDGKCPYETIGTSESVVREFAFEKASEAMGEDYDVIHSNWLKGSRDRYKDLYEAQEEKGRLKENDEDLPF